jgi:S-adenosylmethionine synthetase
MYGYATDETPEFMPLTITLAHQLNKSVHQNERLYIIFICRKLADGRRDGSLAWVRPDSKTQVSNQSIHPLIPYYN